MWILRAGPIGFVAFAIIIAVAPAKADEAALRQELALLGANPSDAWPGIIKRMGGLMRDLQGTPVPEEFHRRMARGEAAVAGASDAGAFKSAAQEFRAAVNAAPWRSEAFYNLGIVQDKAGLFVDAIRNLRVYIAANPDAADAGRVRKLIYQIEYRMEQAVRPKAPKTDPAAEARKRQQAAQRKAAKAQRKAAEARRRNEQRVAGVLGRWRKDCGNNSDTVRFQPGGPGKVHFQLWSATTQPAFWAGKTEFVFEPAANRYVSTGAFGQSAKTVITVVDRNRMRWRATLPGYAHIFNCTLYRTN